MRWIAKCFLWLTTAAVPVFIAACYGAPYRYKRPVDPGPSGRVVDAKSGQLLPGIQIQCLQGDQLRYTTRSAPDGTFRLFGDMPCDGLRFVDTDGAENGGAFSPQEMPYQPAMGEVRIGLEAEAEQAQP